MHLNRYHEEINSERRWMNIRGKCMNPFSQDHLNSQDHLKQIAHDMDRVSIFSVLERTVHSKHESVQRNSFANVIWQNRKKWLRGVPAHHRRYEIAPKGICTDGKINLKLENIGIFCLKEPTICSVFIQNHDHLGEKSFLTKPFWYPSLLGQMKNLSA